jgi:NACHT domain
MAEGSSDNTIKVWPPIVWVCRGIWKRWKILFFIDSVGGIWSGLLLLDRTTLPNLLGVKILERVSPNWPFFLVLSIALVSLTINCGLIARLAVPFSTKELRHSYLDNLIYRTKKSTLEGIPAEFTAKSVDLSDIFIPLQFRQNQPRVDYPLSDEQLKQHEQELTSGIFSPDLQRVLFEAEHNWYTKDQKRFGIAGVWKHLTTSDAVVIQGYPGTGKSTLAKRLTLYMALRLSGQQDTEMPEGQLLTPLLLPVLLSLSEYTKERQKAPKEDLTLDDYITQVLIEMKQPGLPAFIEKKLAEGSCLVILDGLDEVSANMRRAVQEEIKKYIANHLGKQVRANLVVRQNRFLITSRVAGYDQAAFPAYLHVTIAELVDEQIQEFLPRWYLANLCYDWRISVQKSIQNPDIRREVSQRTLTLQKILNENQTIKELAKNPLLLTLIMVIQKNTPILPQQRVELYKVIAQTLLENRQMGREIHETPLTTALTWLGPLALQMQEENKTYVRESNVIDAVVQAIKKNNSGTDSAIRTEAIDFLKRIRERGGLFVQRSGDYFGFMHPAFQQYFATRYILSNINENERFWIDRLVTHASCLNTSWSEPFLLAVAYQSDQNDVIAKKILSAFLARTPMDPLAQHVSHLLLAANAVIEAKKGTRVTIIEKAIAEQLLVAYERAGREQAPAQRETIESVIRHWLLSLPKRDKLLSPLLEIISQALSSSQDITHLCTILTLLPRILDPLDPLVVFETCRPLLDALMSHPDANITNLAQSALNRLDLCVQHST